MRCSTNLAIPSVVCGFLCAAPFVTAPVARAEMAIKETKAQKVDPNCTRQELKIWALIEKRENEELQASSMLVDAATLLQDAHAMCARGDVRSALTIYQTMLQDLESHLHELGIQAAD